MTFQETMQEETLAAVKNYVQRLREVANFYEANPDVKLPSDFVHGTVYIYGASKEDLIVGAKAFGKAEKVFDEDKFELVKRFPSGAQLGFYMNREDVCKRVVVGTEILQAVTIPAKEEYTIPSQSVDIVEWECGSIFGSEA
jgi:hypothetical protein